VAIGRWSAGLGSREPIGCTEVLNRSNLYNYQRHAVDFIKSKRNCALWVDCGLGKTVSTLTAYADLKASFDANRMLVVAPKRVARTVWNAEVNEWEHLQHLTVSRIVGSEKECFEALKTPADIHTIGRDRLPWLHAQFISQGKQVVKWPWDVVVADESQSFASHSSQRFKALASLRQYTKFPTMIELSGTPMPNGYMKLWSQAYLLDKGQRLGSNPTAFRDRFFTPPAGIFTKWNVKPTAAREIQNLLRDIVISLREEDYLDLPPVVDNFVRCQLSAAAMDTYRRFQREFIAEVAGKTLTAVNAGVLDGKLLQLANGACYHGDKREWTPFHDAKLEGLEETLESIPGKALIAYTFNHDKARIAKVLDKAAKLEGKTWRVLNSDKDFSDWAEGLIDWGVLHPASAGHGLNSVYRSGCEDLIFFGMTNNWEFYKQCRSRLTGGHRRTGRNVRIHHIVADGTRDDDYVALIKRKEADEDSLMAALAVRIR
jgi:hypothetical protein